MNKLGLQGVKGSRCELEQSKRVYGLATFSYNTDSNC